MHWAVAGLQPCSGPTNRAPSCSQVSAPLPAPQSQADRREVSARFPAPFTDLRPGPGPVRSLLAAPALSSHGRHSHRCSPPQPPLLALRQLRPLRQRRRQPQGRATPPPRFGNTNPTLRNPPPRRPPTRRGGRGARERRRPIGPAAGRRAEHSETLIGCSGRGGEESAGIGGEGCRFEEDSPPS